MKELKNKLIIHDRIKFIYGICSKQKDEGA